MLLGFKPLLLIKLFLFSSVCASDLGVESRNPFQFLAFGRWPGQAVHFSPESAASKPWCCYLQHPGSVKHRVVFWPLGLFLTVSSWNCTELSCPKEAFYSQSLYDPLAVESGSISDVSACSTLTFLIEIKSVFHIVLPFPRISCTRFVTSLEITVLI